MSTRILVLDLPTPPLTPSLLRVPVFLLRSIFASEDTLSLPHSKEAEYVGIITDRTAGELLHALDLSILSHFDFVQVRKSFFCGKPHAWWYSKKLKPHESVFYRLETFRKSKSIRPCEVFVITDDYSYGFMAKTQFGYRTSHDVFENVEQFQIVRAPT